jgi:hypothetical protein
MEKPVLVIESEPDDDFLTGSCSICPRVRFKLSGNDLKHKELLRAMFDLHLRRVHSVDKRGEDERAP